MSSETRSVRVKVPSHATVDACPDTSQTEPVVTAKKPRAPAGHGPLAGVVTTGKPSPAEKPSRWTLAGGRKSRAFKTRLLSCEKLDGRTHARKYFIAVAKGISADLGGADQLSTVQKGLVEAFAGIAVHVHNFNAHLLRGDKVDILMHTQAVSSLVRVASRIGLRRVARDITTLQDIMNEEIVESEEIDEASP